MFGNKKKKWEQWFEKNFENLMLYARWKTRNEQDAQDVIQRVFESSWRDFKSKSPEDLKALVYKKISQRAIDFYRSIDSQSQREKQYGEFTVIDCEQPDEGNFLGCITEDTELQKMALEKISSLDPVDQEIITLHIFNELSYRQIAEVTGVSKSRVACRYKSAMNELKGQLKQITAERCNY